MIFFVLVTLCCVIWYIYRLINVDKQRPRTFSSKSNPKKWSQRSSTQQTPLNRSEALSLQPTTGMQHSEVLGKSWFQNQMLEYKKKMLAYCVSQAARKMNFSATSIIKLHEQFGHVTLQPSLAEFEAGFMQQGLSAKQLDEVGIDWLAGNGINANATDWESRIESFILQQSQREAEQIVQQNKVM